MLVSTIPCDTQVCCACCVVLCVRRKPETAISNIDAATSIFFSLGTGAYDFFHEPAKGIRRGPKEFGKGAAKGTASLLGNTFAGLGKAASGVTGAVGGGLAALTFDAEYVQRRNEREAAVRSGKKNAALAAAQGVGGGVASGIAGVFLQPVKGARSGGVGGFFKGVAKGVTGLVTKPTSGLLEAASHVTSKAGKAGSNASVESAINRTERSRAARLLRGEDRVLVPSSFEEEPIRAAMHGALGVTKGAQRWFPDGEVRICSCVHVFMC